MTSRVPRPPAAPRSAVLLVGAAAAIVSIVAAGTSSADPASSNPPAADGRATTAPAAAGAGPQGASALHTLGPSQRTSQPSSSQSSRASHSARPSTAPASSHPAPTATIRSAQALPTPRRTATAQPTAVPPVSAGTRAQLPVADTYGTVGSAPIDTTTPATGALVHISQETVAFTEPGGTPVARIPAHQVGVPTWLPIIDSRAGWWQVRLPSRPNGAVAWIPSRGLETRSTDYRVVVSLSAGTMTVYDGKQTVGRWTVGYGRASLPTPATRTFVMTRFHDPNQPFSPVIFALGAHSDAMATFEGGPGTIAIHGWPAESGRDGPDSHGCVRVPLSALDPLRKVPNGTPVHIQP